MWVERNVADTANAHDCIRGRLDGVGFALLRSGENSSPLMAYLSLPALLRGLLLTLLCVGASGCAGAPAQEMSNARQAIKAAREAGAEKVAPQTLNEAQSLLEQAEDSLQKGDYRNARRSAVAAKGRATEALSAARPVNRKESG
jgi:cobalamin biosynthesis protein CobD/CbiB